MNEFDAYRARQDRDTLQKLLEAQGQAAYNVCYQVLREASQAEDAAQQVLLDLVKQIPRLTDASHLKAWVSRAAFHAALDLKKKERRRTAHERRTAEMQDAPTLTPDQIEAVHAEISRLEDDLRTVVVEHYFEKRPLKDLAAEQAISEVAVWKRLQKAKERLRQSLAATGFSAALLGLDPLLEALEPVRAPKGLVGPGLMAQAAVLLSGGAPLVLAGGLAVKTKLIGAGGLIALALAATFGYALHRQRERRPEEPASTRTAPEKKEVSSASSVGRSSSAAADAPPPAVVAEEERLRFTSFMAYYEALMKASYVVDPVERARAFRRLGLQISDAEMAELSKGFPFRPGTEEFSKHIQNAVDMRAKRDAKTILDQARGFTDIDDKLRMKLLRQGLAEWARTDAAAARAYAEALTEREGRSAILMELSPKSTPAGLTQLLALPESPERSSALHAAVTAITRTDPAAARRTIEALPRGPERRESLRSLVSEWGRTDFAAALAWVETIDPKDREDLILFLVSAGAEKDPHAAGRAAVKHADPKLGPSHVTFSPVIREMVKTDPAAAAKLLDQVPQMQGRSILMVQSLAPYWGASDPVEALVWAQQLPANEQSDVINAVLKGWVKSPKGKLEEARAMTGHLPEAFRAKALETVVVAWAEIDPSAAAAFALAEVPATMTDVIARWMRRDEAAAESWVRGLSDPDLRDKAYLGMSGVFQQINFAKSIRAAEEIQNPAIRDKALGRLATSAAKINFDQGAEILRKIGDPAVRDGSLSLIVAIISRDQPRRAMAAIDLIADPAKRTAAIDSFLSHGAHGDPEAALEMLGRLGKVESIQAQRVAAGFAQKDPVAAATWALTLPERQMEPDFVDRTKEREGRPRESALNSIMNEWAAKDPDAATRWIKQAELPAALKTSLLQTVRFQRDFRNR